MTQQEHEKNYQPPEPAQPGIIGTSAIIYGAMTGVGLLVSGFVHENLSQNLAVTGGIEFWGKCLGLAGLGTGVLLILTYFFEEYVPSFSDLRQVFAQVLGRISVFTAFYLALISAVGEELLFRGAIQPSLGVLATSLLFGLMHLGPSGRISSWSVWAALAGLLLGWMYWASQSLWPPILCHFLVNFISMLRLRRNFSESPAVEAPVANDEPGKPKKEKLQVK